MIPAQHKRSILLLTLQIQLTLVASQSAFRFDGLESLSLANESLANSSSLIWQPLRATFRPLNRQSPSPPPAPTPPQPPSPPAPPSPESAALISSESESAPDLTRFSSALESIFSSSLPSTTPAPSSILTSPSNLDDEDLPTRVPLNRFRPTRPPSVDAQSQPAPLIFNTNTNSWSQNSNNNNNNQSATNQLSATYRITNECFECICEASTSCNANSRCQTSDVRHTRCGLFLISYDQWIESGLSKQLVTREALSRDAAADERAFYECVTERSCAERLMSIFMQKNAKDCDKDGRINCYDVAAIHQGGIEQCSSESLLESQYWNDFNACFGFGR